MIIFSLDGTLSDCEHRRHFIDPTKNENATFSYDDVDDLGQCLSLSRNYYFKNTENKWKPDWQAFYEACDQDKPINPTAAIYEGLAYSFKEMDIQIWSGRCESVREKTLDWITSNFYWESASRSYLNATLKMRPIGDNTPDDQLQEKWLDEALIEGKIINFVFASDKKSIGMYRRRRIFVFNCCQHDGEF